MTVRAVYDYLMIELNKASAPTVSVEDFVYMLNKSINDYCNIKYNAFGLNQQLTDDLKALIRTSILTTIKPSAITPFNSPVFTLDLPNDYFHLLNCFLAYELKTTPTPTSLDTMGGQSVSYTQAAQPSVSRAPSVTAHIKVGNYYGVRKMTTNNMAMILNNYYYKPKLNQPYYLLGKNSIDFYCGILAEKYTPSKVSFTYLKKPEYVSITEDQLYELEDTSQVLEFDEYVCQEIINRLVTLVLENTGNQRLSTAAQINQTIQPQFFDEPLDSFQMQRESPPTKTEEQ